MDLSQAMPLALLFCASVILGLFLGMLIDRLFSTKPIGMIFFLFLGFGFGLYACLKNSLTKP